MSVRHRPHTPVYSVSISAVTRMPSCTDSRRTVEFDGLTLSDGHETLAPLLRRGDLDVELAHLPARCEMSRTGKTNGPFTCFLTTTASRRVAGRPSARARRVEEARDGPGTNGDVAAERRPTHERARHEACAGSGSRKTVSISARCRLTIAIGVS
jgi:hypothetical protein